MISAVIFFNVFLNLAVIILGFMCSQEIMAMDRDSDVNIKTMSWCVVLHLPESLSRL